MASLRRNKALSPDGETAKFLYTIIKQLDLKIIDWNIVADGLGITNGHAARMRYSRFKQHIEGIPTQSRSAKAKNDGKKEGKAAKGQKRKSPDGEEGGKVENKAEKMHEPAKEEVFKMEAAASDILVASVKPEPGIKTEPALDHPLQACHGSQTVDVKLEQMPANTTQPPHDDPSTTEPKQEPGAKKRSPSGQAKPKSPVVTTIKPEPEPPAPAATINHAPAHPPAPAAAAMKPFIYPPPSGWYPIPTPHHHHFPPPPPPPVLPMPSFNNVATEAITFDANPYRALHSPSQMSVLPEMRPPHSPPPAMSAPPEMRPLHPPPDMTTVALSDLHLSPSESAAMPRPAPSWGCSGWAAQPWPEQAVDDDQGVRPSAAQPLPVLLEQSLPSAIMMVEEARSGIVKAEPGTEQSKQAMDEGVRPAVKHEPSTEDEPMPEAVSVKSEAVVT